MESKAHYALVGAVVVLFTIGLVAVILWLSDATGRGAERNYAVYFRNQSLSGLQVDSHVTMKGIKVGSVDNFTISPTDIERVKVIIRVSAETPVKSDTVAIIKRNLLTGLGWVELEGSTAASDLLTGIPKGEDFPVIPEGETQLDQIANSIPGLIDTVSEMAQRAAGIFSEENYQRVTAILINIEKFTTTLASSDEELRDVIKNLNVLSTKLLKMSDSLERISKNADTNFDQLVSELKVALDHVSATAKTLDQESVLLSKSLRGAIDVIVLDVTNVATDLSSAAKSFGAAMGKLEDPKAILVGPSQKALGPGERARQ